jgi:hypothetical protein
VAERLGHPQDTALTLGRFVTGSMARRLGIMDEAQETVERRVRAAVTEPWLRTRSVRGRVGAQAISPDLPTHASSRAHDAVA